MNKKRLSILSTLLCVAILSFALLFTGCGSPAEISATKTASISQGKTLYSSHALTYEDTVYRGENVTYTFEIQNKGGKKAQVTVTDTLPENTKIIAGNFTVDGQNLSWNGKIKGGTSKKISYTLQITGDSSLYDGGKISGKNAIVNGTAVTTNDLYLEQTLNPFDTKYLELAIKVFTKFDYYSGIDLAQRIYTAAFTNTSVMKIYSDNLTELFAQLTSSDSAYDKLKDTVAPSMFGGKQLTQEISGVKGKPNTTITKADLVIGDLLFVQNNADYKYIVGENNELYDLNNTLAKADTQDILDSLGNCDKYVLVRPSVAMTFFSPADPDEKELELEEYQEAVLATAQSFFLRGDNMQYEDSTFNGQDQERSSYGKTPEFYTYQNTGYSNCAMFTFDVYYSTFGKKLPGDMWTTMALTNISQAQGCQVYQIQPEQMLDYTEEQKIEEQRKFFSLLQPGDLFTVRRTTGTGHVMMYMGNGRFVHSSGSTLRKPNETRPHTEDVREATVRYHKVYDYLFNPQATNYIFGGTITYLTITRPSQNQFFGTTVSDQAKARVQNLKGVRVDKLSSHPLSQTVNVGEEITYTFSIFNTNSTPVTLDITDKAPANTTYVSGAEKNNNGMLCWSITVEPNQTKTVSYTVKVNDGVADRTLIYGKDAVVGGVKVECPAVAVRNTLTTEQQVLILDAINTLKSENTSLGGLELVNAIYQTALNKTAFDMDIDTLLGKNNDEGLFYFSQKVELNNYGAYFKKYMVRNLYGGENLYVGTYKAPFLPDLNYNTNSFVRRTEVVTEYNLVVGDVLLIQMNDQVEYYIYSGNKTFINVTNGIENDTLDFTTRCVRLLESQLYAVVRPSMSF